MEIDVIRSLEITYSRWNRNHPAKNETGLRINATVLNLASALTFSGDNSADEILLKAQSEFKLNDSQTEKLFKQAELISDHAKGMPERLSREISSKPTEPTIAKTNTTTSDFEGKPLDVFELTGKELKDALSRLDPEERRLAIKYFIDGKTSSQIGVNDANAAQKIISKMRVSQFGREQHIPDDIELEGVKTDEEAEGLFDTPPRRREKSKKTPNRTLSPETLVAISNLAKELVSATRPTISESPVEPVITPAAPIIENPPPTYPDNSPSKPFWREEIRRRSIPEPRANNIQTLPDEWNDDVTQAYFDSLIQGEAFLLPKSEYPSALRLSKKAEEANSGFYLQTLPGRIATWHYNQEKGFPALPVDIVVNKGVIPERYSLWLRKYLHFDAGLSEENLSHLLRRDQFNPVTILITAAATSLFFRTRETKTVHPSVRVYTGPAGGYTDFLAAEHYDLAMYVKEKGEDKFHRVLQI